MPPTMKERDMIGDTYTIDSGPHDGHTATIKGVRFKSSRSKLKIVSVECSCGESWVYEDRPPYNLM